MFRKKTKREKEAPASEAAWTPHRLPPAPETDPRDLNGLTLAFIGDGVYELLVRDYILTRCGGNVQALHERTVSFSNAAFQCEAAKKLLPTLDEEEAAVFRRGRNARAGHVPKNKTQAEYHTATGLEALFGYLYLTGRTERLETLFETVRELNEEMEHGNKTAEEK